jgi:hypothetical protein
MKKYFPPTSPVPFKDQYEIDTFTQEHALGDVVKSASPPRLGFHVDVHAVKGDERRLVAQDGDDHDDEVHDHVPPLDDHDRDHDYDDEEGHRTREAATVNDRDDDAQPQRRALARDESVDLDERVQRRQLLERDRFERAVYRERVRREQHERRSERATHRSFRRGGRAPRRARSLDDLRERTDRRDPELSANLDQRDDAVRDRRSRGVSGDNYPGVHDHLSHVATHSQHLKRPLATRAQGAAMVLYFALLPYVVYSKWRQLSHDADAEAVRALLVLLVVFWCASLGQVLLNVRRLRRGRRVNGGASAWLAGLVVAFIALLIPAAHATHSPVAQSISRRAPESAAPPSRPSLPRPLAGVSSVPLALMAKRRQDLLREGNDDPSGFDIDESIELLRSRDPDLIARLAGLAGDRSDGVLDVTEEITTSPSESTISPMVACSLGPSAAGTLVGFSREGGQLPVRPSWSSEDLERNIVTLHDGRVLFVRSEPELLRALATRSLRQSIVVYLGPASEVDDELAACTITVLPYVERGLSEQSALVVSKPAPQVSDVRVELLRADPQVVGLLEPFTPTLRRRCVEMVAYLAVHRHEPVTGERLRTRVLTHADVDASLRTLANTASAVRRSLGVDALGSRLHPVSSSGLYVTHGLSSDVELFSTLVTRARQLPVADASTLAHQALLLIKGEPLASALRGFEWFLAEGHGARLARDGEWAALVLHHEALQRGKYELAFWSLQQGLLIDPYSDALSEALSRVPRLREFGGDGAGATQHGSVGARSAVAMSWSFARFTQQVSQ